MPIDVRMPDGTLVKDVPDNITQADLMARFDAFKAQGATPVQPQAPIAPVTGPEGAPIPPILQTPPPVPPKEEGNGWIPTWEQMKHEGFAGRIITGEGMPKKAGEENLPTPSVGETFKALGTELKEHPTNVAKAISRSLLEDPELLLPQLWEAWPAKLAKIVQELGVVGKTAVGAGRAAAVGAGLEAAAQARTGEVDGQQVLNTAAQFGLMGPAVEVVKNAAKLANVPLSKVKEQLDAAKIYDQSQAAKATQLRAEPEIKAPEVKEPAKLAPESLSHDSQSMLDELNGKDIELKPEQFEEAKPEVKPEVPKAEPEGVISETEKEFTPVGGRLINKADVDKLNVESRRALEQNLETQAIEQEKQLKREAREEKFKEPPTQTLSARLVQEGGIAKDQKLDTVNETGKVEGYNHVFREDGNDLLTLVKDGKLDEYLPPEIRSSATPPDGLFDARPGYNFISDIMKSGEKVHTYDYEMAKLQHENMVYEKNLAKKQMEPNEAARAAAAEEQGKIYLSEGKVEGGSTPDIITQAVKKEFGSEGGKLLDNNKLVIVKDINELKDKGYIGNRIDQLTNNTRAFYDPITDRSYFISDRIKPDEVRAMALHEVGTHYGMQKMLGEAAYKNVLDNIERLHKTDKAVKAAWDETLKSYAHLLEENKPIFLEEVLAHLGETAPNHPLWKRVLMKVKEFLIKNGIIKNISAAELQDLVRTSLRRASKEAKAPEIKTPQEIVASQRPPVNFKGQEVESQWHGPEESKIDDWLYKLQDKHIDTKRVQQIITKAGHEIEDNWNVYEKEMLYHGRTASGIRNFLLKEVLPAVKTMQRLRVTPEEIHDYLLNRHAEERNNQMNKINPDVYDPETNRTITNPLKDKGSGIHTDDARRYLENLDPAKKRDLEEVARYFDEMKKGTQDILVASGAETRDTINKWNQTYKHYVPLNRVEDSVSKIPGMVGTGQGLASRGAFSKRAMGSLKEHQDILGNLIAQRERAIIRSEKIRVGRALYGLAIQSPNPDFWLPINPDAIKSRRQAVAELTRLGIQDADQVVTNLMAEPKERYLKQVKQAEGIEPEENFDFDSGLPVNESKEVVGSKVNVMARYNDNVFPVRVNGKDRFIFFNMNDPRAMRMVKALKNLDVEELGTIENIAGHYTRWFKNVNTQYNPVFGLKNFMRDYSAGNLNLTNTPIAGKQAQITADMMPAMRGILQVHRAERKGITDVSSDWGKFYQRMRDEGFQTGYRDSLIRNQEEMQIIDNLLEQMNKKGLSANAKNAFYKIAGTLTDFNDMMENSIRLAAAKAALDKGLSPQKAAVIAKNITVNFDKKGAKTREIGALYAFFNPAVQGTERIYQTLKGPAGKAIIGGGILAGMIQAVLMEAAGYDENDPPEFTREKSFIIPMPDGHYIPIPYPQGYNVLPNVGRQAMDFIMHGGKNPGKHIADLTASMMDSLSPLGTVGWTMQSIAPTALDPLAALAENKDAFGRPISRPDRATAPTPGYTRSRDTASTLGKGIAEFLNFASGGDKYIKGSVSPTGDQVDFLAGQVGGGLYREASKAVQYAKAKATGEEVPSYRVPLVGQFHGEVGQPAAIAQEFYANVTRITDHENTIKGLKKDKLPTAEYIAKHPEARLWNRANGYENEINALNKQKRTLIERGASKERIKKIDDKKTAKMKQFNDQVKALNPD